MLSHTSYKGATAEAAEGGRGQGKVNPAATDVLRIPAWNKAGQVSQPGREQQGPK